MADCALFLPRLAASGGVERFGLSLASELCVRGYSVDFFCSRVELGAGELPQGVRVVQVWRPPLTRFAKVGWFARACDRYVDANPGTFTIALGKAGRCDVARLSGAPLPVFWRLSAQAWESVLSRGFKSLRRRLSPANALIAAIERQQVRGARHLVANSALVRQWFCEAYPFLAQRHIPLAYNKPDLSRFSRPVGDPLTAGDAARAVLGLPDRQNAPVLLGFAGNNFRLKGLAQLIRAVARMGESTHLCVAGSRRPGLFARLAQRLGCAQRVHFLGRVADMPTFYHALSCFVLPTFCDASSNAVAEALACGTRTVSTVHNGSSTLLDPACVIPDPADPAQILATVRHALSLDPPTDFVWPAISPDNIPSGIIGFTDHIESLRMASG